MKRFVTIAVAASLALGTVAPAARAAVNIERSSQENPVVEVSRSVIYGGLAGLVIGSAFALAGDGGNDGDVVRWCFVGGTLVGFAAGVYFVANRPQPEAAIELGDGVEFHVPTIARSPAGTAQIALVGYRF